MTSRIELIIVLCCGENCYFGSYQSIIDSMRSFQQPWVSIKRHSPKTRTAQFWKISLDFGGILKGFWNILKPVPSVCSHSLSPECHISTPSHDLPPSLLRPLFINGCRQRVERPPTKNTIAIKTQLAAIGWGGSN